MPTYEYACTKCGEHLEVSQSFRDEPLTRHPGCGGKLTKVFGSVGIVLKGSGFYKTDSRAGARGDGAAEPKPAESKPPGPKQPESKPAGSKPADTGTKPGSGPTEAKSA